MPNLNFCIIIGSYCDSITEFVKAIKRPTNKTIRLIKNTTSRTQEFDDYVDDVCVLNEIIINIVAYIKLIISSLTKLFVVRGVENLIDFIRDVDEFMKYLVEDEIFNRINQFEFIKGRYIKKTNFEDNLTRIKVVIFKLFNISLDVAIVFIPQMSRAKDVLIAIEDTVNEMISNGTTNDMYNMELISTKLSMVSINSNSLKDLICIRDSDEIDMKSIDAIQRCLNDKNADDILARMESIKADYVEIHQFSINLMIEIKNYKMRKVRVGIMKKLSNLFSGSKKIVS